MAKADKTGRSIAANPRSVDASPTLYVAHTLAMRESAAWRGLPDIPRRILDRLEVEHLRHKLRDNGKLIGTYADFEAWGLRRSSVRLGIEICVALGFLEITRRGWKSIPSLYRLTYVKTYKDSPPITDEWARFRTDREVRAAIKQVLASLDEEKVVRKEKKARKAASPSVEANL